MIIRQSCRKAQKLDGFRIEDRCRQFNPQKRGQNQILSLAGRTLELLTLINSGLKSHRWTGGYLPGLSMCLDCIFFALAQQRGGLSYCRHRALKGIYLQSCAVRWKQHYKGGPRDSCVLVENKLSRHRLREASVLHDSEHPDGAVPLLRSCVTLKSRTLNSRQAQ